MGRMQAEEIRRLADFDTALTWHLTHNHYPSVPVSMLPACKLAIVAYQDERYHEEIPLPAGISYRDRRTAPASAIVEQHHLDAFIDSEGEY